MYKRDNEPQPRAKDSKDNRLYINMEYHYINMYADLKKKSKGEQPEDIKNHRFF